MKRAVLFLVAAAAVAGCGGGETTTVTEKTVTEKQPAAPKAPKARSPRGKSSGGSISVPNVVGKNHQDAQDEMQAAGLFILSEEDVTGQGRNLLVDSNWEVVRQKPAAGTKTGEDTTITLFSKKIGE